MREKKLGSDAYRKALDTQVTISVETYGFVTVKVTMKLKTGNRH